MAKGTRGRRRIASRQCRPTPYPLQTCDQSDGVHQKNCSKIFVKKDWEDATCSVCMEYPHNAVLLLCSSHDKGCRPYMCGTSFRYSNCLDQYKKAYTKVASPHPNHSVDNPAVGAVSSWPAEKCEVTELACPLCRGQVKGWTVVEAARGYLNAKKRNCMQENCSFVGTYKELRKHVRAEHPCARPREVDPVSEQKWRSLERERERDDVISTITSSMPGAVVFGDYVIEGSHYGFDTDEEEGFDVDAVGRNGSFDVGIDSNLMNVFFLLHAFGPSGDIVSNRRMRLRRFENDSNHSLDGGTIGNRHTTPIEEFDSSDQDSDGRGDDDDANTGMSLVGRLRRQGRVLLGRSGRRRRQKNFYYNFQIYLEMAKGTRGRRRIASRQCRPTPYPLQTCDQSDGVHQKNCSKIFVKKDWEDATCSVCMEYPHNAVLLLCSSHDKGCRPYMCGTSFRFSNCLDQYKKAYTKVASPHPNHSVDNPAVGAVSSWPAEKCEVTELACPLCRGQVKGWTVVEAARGYLNAKKRNCMQENCSFVGTYKELRKHVRAEHPCARPREVDPVSEQKWRSLERERERDDVISTITSSMPGAVVFGDYVIEGSHYGFDTDEEEGFDVDAVGRNGSFDVGIDSNLMNVFFLLHAFGPSGDIVSNRRMRLRRFENDSNHPLDGGTIGNRHTTPIEDFDSSDQDSDGGGDNDDDDDANTGMSLVGRLRRQGRVLLGRSGRRRRRRETNAADQRFL
ncbi:unnamed protein product [Ilex paraguariensis]|uniref:Uncharacterized protein n=1 Tax=Ilex paraguariensis TaxID=185542 RepID=A0ABC8S1Z3_9AQUA